MANCSFFFKEFVLGRYHSNSIILCKNYREAVCHCMPMAKKDPGVEQAVHPLWGYLVACVQEGQQVPYQAGIGAHPQQLWLHLKKRKK